MSVVKRLLFAMVLIILASLYIFPWKNFGINVDIPFLEKPYVLGLDLQGGVELDYKVDFSALRKQTGSTESKNETAVIEGLKKIIDKRVNSLGLAEPNIQTLQYGTDVHLIVQIPTESYADLSPVEREKQQQKDIETAKEVIGKVVQLEFKELRSSIVDEDKQERKQIAEDARIDIENMDFKTLSQKYTSQNERVYLSQGEGKLPQEANILNNSGVIITGFPYISPVVVSHMNSGAVDATTGTGFVVVKIDEKMGDNSYKYSYVFVDETPSAWKIVRTKDGKTLNDKYLTSASAGLDETGSPQVLLTFNEEGKKIFGEITTTLVGQPLAIFVGGELITDPIINSPITNGQAKISGPNMTYNETKQIADDITTGIVPAPIYLTSERVIDAKIGEKALNEILIAGLIGLAVIIIFLAFVYRIGGLLAGLALFSYAIFLIAMVKISGVVLTLAAIAGVILSIGLAIDANILIFERIHEVLKQGMPLKKAISIGFKHSWTAIWDSHITSFMSAFILFAFGISMIKGFGFMLGLGIILSLFTAMWVSRTFLMVVAKKIKNPNILVGYHKEKK